MIDKWNSLSYEQQQERKTLQVVMEEDLLSMGINKYWKDFNRAPDEGEPEQQLLDASVIHLQPVFQYWIDEACQKRATPAWLIPLLSIGSFKAADLVIRNVLKLTLEGSMNGGLESSWGKIPKAQVVANCIAEDVIAIVSYQMTKEQFKEDWTRQSKFTKNWSAKRCKGFTNKLGSVPELSRKNKQDLGHAMLRIALQSDILVGEKIRVKPSKRSKTREHIYIRLSNNILEDLHKKHHLLELSSLVYRPMICPPLDHLPEEPGGNLLRWIRKPTVKKYVNHTCEPEDKITNHCSEEVLRGLNGLQKTEWTINGPVLEVMRNLFEGNACVGNLPAHDFQGFEMRDFPKEGDKVEQAKWMRERESKWGAWYRDEQKRARMLVRLYLANKFEDFDFFYHPYSLDFRGRAYTACELLSPQGSDFDKASILFAEAKPQTERGMYWLKVHTANLFDQDKLSFDERVTWVDDNMQMLLNIVKDPYQNKEWLSDKQKKNPSFQRLAACYELARTDGLTQLPIQMDGKCNGSQHWSVIMGDKAVASLTNVTKNDKPQDLYGFIADQTTSILSKNTNDVEWYDRFIEYWQDGVTRDVVKRPTMCDAYGLTFFGIQKYLKYEGHLDWVEADERQGAVVEMARAVQEGLGITLSLPNAGKDWLRALASMANDCDKHLVWTTPSGFIVEHVYQPIRQRRSYTELFNKKKFELVFANYYGGVNSNGQMLGIAPNYIHSLDAAHMFLTLTRLLNNGLSSFSMIHDSYGVHAVDVDIMNDCLREAFVELHKDNVLETFKQDVEKLLGFPVPAVPNNSGRLDPRCVQESDYFFS